MKRIVGVGVLGAVSAALVAVAVTAWVGVLAGEQPAESANQAASATSASPPVRYAPPTVGVADGVNVDQAEVSAFVDRVVQDPRGWRTDLDQFTVRLVQAGNEGTQRMPGLIGYANPGQRTAAISDEAWTVLGPRFAATGGTLDDQRAWVVLHELGHLLGRPHQECPGAGPAPVMRETNYDLRGCGFNVWPNPAG